MRLADFILTNIEPILVEWETFARTVWPVKEVDPRDLRDHCADILRATVSDMDSAQTAMQQSEKSRGEGERGKDSNRVDCASDVHAIARVSSGFNLLALVAEYRALRASVIRLWRESEPDRDCRDLDDLTRFNESIDQSLTEAVRSYTERVDRSRQMFLAILGHDLRAPLNAMALGAALLAQAGTETLDMAGQIGRSAASMGGMISDLLDFASSALGSAMPLTLAAVNWNKLCRDVVGEIRAAHSTRNVRFEFYSDITGYGDASRLRQMVSNLIGNALHHGASEGAVDLRVRADADKVVLSIHNVGKPIPSELMATIFDPLVRDTSPEAQKRRLAGSIGLGLYIAREVAIAHGGDIDVKSRSDIGTVFTVTLPRRGEICSFTEDAVANQAKAVLPRI